MTLSKVKDNDAKLYYLKATHECAWSRDVLSMQINSKSYARQVLANKQHNFHAALPEQADKNQERRLYAWPIFILDA